MCRQSSARRFENDLQLQPPGQSAGYAAIFDVRWSSELREVQDSVGAAGAGHNICILLNEAYAVLSDPDTRQEYNGQLEQALRDTDDNFTGAPRRAVIARASRIARPSHRLTRCGDACADHHVGPRIAAADAPMRRAADAIWDSARRAAAQQVACGH